MGCSIWDIVANLQKQRQQIGDIQVTAQTIHEDEPPGRFQKINIRYTFTGRDLSEAHIKRAVQLTEDKYCSTYATLREVIELASDYMILKDDDAQPR